MSTSDHGLGGRSGLTDEEWRASLPTFGEPVQTFAVAPSAAAAPTPAPFASPSSSSAGAIAPTLTATPMAAVFGGQRTAPAASVPHGMYRGWTAQPTTASTAAVWWIVFMPIVAAATQVAALFAIAGVNPWAFAMQTDSNTIAPEYLQWVAVSYVLSLASLVASIWLGYRDRAALLALGHPSSASPWWQIVHPLVYLFIRRYHVRPVRGSASPVVVYFVLYVAPVFLAVIAAIAIPLYLAITM